MSSRHILWDADYLVYAAGFAVEHTDYVLTWEDEDGLHVHGTYDSKAKASEVMKENPDLRLWKDGPYLEDDGEIRAKHNMRSMIDGVLKAVTEKLKVKEVTYQMFLTASPNYRDWIATIRPYKGNRANTARPILYDELRKYLVEVWDARVISQIEADDEISLAAKEGEYKDVIVHVDKDLLMIPGLHYNPNKGWATITKERGLREFYRQMITGDTADNIPGIYRAGAKAAKDAIRPGMTEEQMWKTVLAMYEESLGKHGPEKCGYEDARAAAIENARLLWMLTEDVEHTFLGGLWFPPGEGVHSEQNEAGEAA